MAETTKTAKTAKKVKPVTKTDTMPIPQVTTPFDLDNTKEWLEHLDTHGYVIIRDIITEETAQAALDTFKQEVTQVSPNFDWENPTTWVPKNTPMVWNKGSVMFNGFGQSESNWMLRTNSHVKEAFAKIYETDDLVTSFDGISLFLSSKQQSDSWLHQDQRPSDTRVSVQAILNVMPCGLHDAGFVCVPGSHLTYKPTEKQHSAKDDWMTVPKDHAIHADAVKIMTPPRSLILFHSKLVHANTGMRKRHPKGLHINRFSAYTTFVPRSRQPDDVYKKRIQGYFDGIACSHWGDRYEPKKLPFHLRTHWPKRNFQTLAPLTDDDGNIPEERLALI